MSTLPRMTLLPGPGIRDLGARPFRERKSGWVNSSRRGLILAPPARKGTRSRSSVAQYKDSRATTAPADGGRQIGAAELTFIVHAAGAVWIQANQELYDQEAYEVRHRQRQDAARLSLYSFGARGAE